ncbi:MAG: PHP domain-containing protein [Actinomycetota bacterium]|nr:PHP domain-containing protein [Actinomycetota bacterium]
MPVDLHTHSNRSDGSDTPEELIAHAAQARLRAVALTDHDTLAGTPAAEQAARHHRLELVPGIEISCRWETGTMHMLVLFLYPGSGPLQERLVELEGWRATRNRRLLERLRSLGIDISMEEVVAEAGGQGLGRPHFAAVMVRKGVVPDFSAAFRDFLAKGKPAYVDRERLAPEEAISLARASGAVPVVAHPHTMTLSPEALGEVLTRLKEAGLLGLECYYSDYLPEERLRLVELARTVGLVPSGGSDYHGSYKPWLGLGVGQGDLLVPDEVLEELHEARREALAAV